MSDETKLTTTSGSGGISFDTQNFAFGQRIGLKTSNSSTQAVEDAITALTQVPGDLLSILGALFGPGSDSPDATFGYDPSVKWLAGLNVTYGVLTLEILLVDGQFYGLIIKIGKADDGNGKGNGNGNDNGKNKIKVINKTKGDGNGNGNGEGEDDQPFAGLELEIIYRKINDHLGEFSADLTLPDKFRKIDMGEASITLPSVGLSIWTNGDFKVSIGWPLGDRSFNIAFPPSPIPWAGGGGLYFARLRSEDDPGNLTGKGGIQYNPIIEFGIGLRIGAATEGEFGICSYGASIYLFGTFQGFLAWQDAPGHGFSHGLDYYWFCASVGITGHLEGSVDFVVISVSVSLDITASVTLALETGHASFAIAEFTATVEASIKILFIRIHFSFTLDVSVSLTFGSGPQAQISGPTPAAESDALNALPEPAQAALAGGLSAEVSPGLAGELGAEVSSVAQPEVSVTAPPPPVPVALSFMLQPSIRFDVPSQKWVSVGVASLIIDRTAPSIDKQAPALGLAQDSFSLMIESLASYLLQTYGGYTDPTANVTTTNLQQLEVALGMNPNQGVNQSQSQDQGTSQFNLAAVYQWLNSSNVQFTVTGVTPSSTGSPDGALFPIIPGLILTYNSVATTFGDQAAAENYLTVMQNYFAELSLVGDGSLDTEGLMAALLDAAPVATSTWMPGVIFADYFNILAKQLCRELLDVTATTPGTLATDLGAIDIGNLAGIATRFLQHGLRLPDPNDLSSPLPTMNLLPVFDLTGQQFDLSPTVLTAALSGTPPVPVTIAGTGTAQLQFALDQAPIASPIWAPEPLPRINNVQSSFLLRQGLPWGQTVSSTTTNWLMFGFPDTLQSQLRLAGNLSLTLDGVQQTAGGQTTLTPANGLGSLMIRFSLTQVPNTGSAGFLKNVFLVKGTDESTRDLMELLFESNDIKNKNLVVSMLRPMGAVNSGSGYTTSNADATTVIFKNNLSTLNQPAMGMFAAVKPELTATPLPPLGATSAVISDASDFLLLMWECSVVNSGGFYLYVPDLDFGTAQQVDVALIVKSASAPASQAPVTSYQNTILVDTASFSSTDRLQGAVFESDGTTPVTEPKPNYPAGTISFGATWENAPTDATFADTAAYSSVLYQMLEFQIAPGTDISKGSPWSMPLGPNTPPTVDSTTWVYQRAVPVYRFVDNAATPPNRYGAIGLNTTLNLQLVDIFGNPFELKALQAMPVYNDPLMSIDEWPGTYILYSFIPAAGGQATLQLTVCFIPSQVAEKQTALPYYQTIFDQLTDPRTSMAVTTALAAGPVTMTATGGAALQAALTTYVAEIVAYLTPNSTTQPPSCLLMSGTVTVDYVTQIDEDLFPLWVSLTTTRNAPVETDTYPYPDGFLSVVSQLPPLLNPNSDPTVCPDPTVVPDSAALRAWSIGFENAFNNFDNVHGLLKVLVGAPPEKVTATKSKLGTSAAGDVTSTPGDLWALKWGVTNGTSVTFGNNTGEKEQAPVYFAPLPLSTELISTTVPIDTYDSSGNKLPPPLAPTIFNGVDMDGLGRSFLAAVDGLLSPELANAMAQLDPVQYNNLMIAKEGLAFAIASSITWVLADQMPTEGNSAGMGDLDSAQTRFRESLLATLGSDYGTAVIVQLPATVTVKNQFETDDDSSQPPDFYGTPTPANVTNQYTISTTALPVTDGTGYLNFLVGAPDPTLNADLQLGFDFDISFLDHEFQTSEEQFGYIPSSWLRFIVPDVDPTTGLTHPVLDVPMGQLDIPLPLRAYPSPPRLVSQNATSTFPRTTTPTNPPPTTIAQATEFDYNLVITRPQVAQDDLHITVEFNSADPTQNSLTGTGGDLFAALANFQAFQAASLPAATQSILANDGNAKTWLGDIVSVVQAVSNAWQAGEALSAEDAVGDTLPVPAPFEWDFKLQVEHEDTAPNVFTFTWTSTTTPTSNVWPLINGNIGVGSGNVMTYTLDKNDPNLNQPTFTWQELSVITNQSVSAIAWIERNENLASGEATNPAFVYTTAKVTFPSPVIPLLEVQTTLTLTSANVNDAVNQLVTQVMAAAATLPGGSQVGWGLETDYSFILVSGPSAGQQLQTKLPVFLVRTEVSTASGTLPSGVEPPSKLISDLETALSSWYNDFHPSTTQASMLFELTIFAANSQQPLALLVDIETPITGANWWNP